MTSGWLIHPSRQRAIIDERACGHIAGGSAVPWVLAGRERTGRGRAGIAAVRRLGHARRRSGVSAVRSLAQPLGERRLIQEVARARATTTAWRVAIHRPLRRFLPP